MRLAEVQPRLGRGHFGALRVLAGLVAAVCVASIGVGWAQAPISETVWTRSALLGDLGGLRSSAANDGVTLGVLDSDNLLGDVAGGIKQGATLQGLTTATMQIDTGKAFDLPGGMFNVSALQIHGRSLSPYYLNDLQTASGTEAADATRLWELWYDQSVAGGTADFKIGQQSVDQEFIVSQYSGLFVNTMAGWPLLPSTDLYAGGPAYPLSSLGVRLRLKPRADLTLLGGVFDDNPPGGRFANDPQSRDAGGTRFNLNTGALFMAEAQLGGSIAGEPGTYKLGFWYDMGSFSDQMTDNIGLSLANPASDGVPVAHHGNVSLYGVVDQILLHPKGSARTLAVFARLMGTPPDRNLVSFSANFGLTLADPMPGRDNDTAGIDVGIGKVSGAAAALDRASALYGDRVPVRGTETLFELTYQAQIVPWLQLQPVTQYVVNPGAGIADPVQPARRLRNEVVVGLRSNVVF